MDLLKVCSSLSEVLLWHCTSTSKCYAATAASVVDGVTLDTLKYLTNAQLSRERIPLEHRQTMIENANMDK